LNKVQDRYDAETDNNRNNTMQAKWENMIGNWLDNRTNLDLYLKNFN